ncbi:MAG TPA: CRTAC1 family protein [Candidatus Polarisedimenticolaceae bacterium]|nr:CRTAC1 family protein [Candidatus Polarisedimenticolaceae bacterium]
MSALLLAGTVRADAPAPGHARMLAWLRQIQAEAEERNPNFGSAAERRLEQQLAGLPAVGPSDPRRWYLQFMLGSLELQQGRAEAAIEHHAEAYRLLGPLGGKLGQDESLETILRLGVAYMRWGETQNCALRHTADSCLLPIRGGGVHKLPEGSRSAMRYFNEVLAHTPADSRWHLRARWLLNIAAMTLGQYPDGVPERERIPPAAFESAEPFPRFPDVSAHHGLNRFDLAGGTIVDDLDGDGLLDILASSWDTAGQLRSYRNSGDGRFVERTEQAGLAGELGGLNLVQADYDNDGDVDALVLRGAWWGEQGRHPNSLLRNDGAGNFTDVTFDAGLAEPAYPTQTAAWADFDNDGDLDLYVGNESGGTVRAPSQLFRNNGDGTFADIAAVAGVTNDRFAKGVVWGDYDLDRFADLYVSNLGADNRLYHNNRDGTFTDVARAAGVTRPLAGFPAWFWDYDNDGNLDIYAGAFGAPGQLDVADVACTYLGLPPQAEPPRLYRGDGRGGFRDVSAEIRLPRVALAMGANFGDLDNDGYLDFYLGTGFPAFDALMPNLMFHNRGGNGFADVTTAGGFGHLQKGHGVAFADLDNDGDQDVYEQMGGAYRGDGFADVLFANPGFGHHWIKISLHGVRSNRAGVGARLHLVVLADGKERSIYKHVNSGGSFGANPLRQEIGLGDAQRVERLEVFWPATGDTQVFNAVPADRWIEVTEGRADYRQRELKRFALGS